MMMRSITDKSSDIDISETVVALIDMLVVALPNTTLNEYGEKRTLTKKDKERETETVCNDFGMTREGEADVVQLHSISLFLSGYRFELCVAVHGKAFLLLPSTHKAPVSFDEAVKTTGRATDHVNAIKTVFHGQKFKDETIKDASPQVLAAMNNALSLFFIEILSDIDPELNADRVVHTLASDFCEKLTPEQRELQMKEWKETGQKLGKVKKTAWNLYNNMMGAVVSSEMSDDMLVSMVGMNCKSTAWLKHKSGPNCVVRSVEIAAIESAYRAVIEKRRLAVEKKLVNAELHRLFAEERKATEKLDIEFRRHDRILAKEEREIQRLEPKTYQPPLVDFKTSTVGISQLPSGNWQAVIFYSRKIRYLGTFDTQETATLAYYAASAVLRNAPLTTNKAVIDRTLSLAKMAVEESVAFVLTITPPTEPSTTATKKTITKRKAKRKACSSSTDSREDDLDEKTMEPEKLLRRVRMRMSKDYKKNDRIGAYAPAQRAVIIQRFHSKRARRVWKKKVRHIVHSRKPKTAPSDFYHVRIPSGQPLGIKLNDTIVEEVGTCSVLFGKVSVGDRIINIDGVDITCKSDIWTVIARTPLPERILRLKRAI